MSLIEDLSIMSVNKKAESTGLRNLIAVQGGKVWSSDGRALYSVPCSPDGIPEELEGLILSTPQIERVCKSAKRQKQSVAIKKGRINNTYNIEVYNNSGELDYAEKNLPSGTGFFPTCPPVEALAEKLAGENRLFALKDLENLVKVLKASGVKGDNLVSIRFGCEAENPLLVSNEVNEIKAIIMPYTKG